jgi:hypothetical protein
MLRTTLIALSLVAGAVVVVFGYSYARGTLMTHVDPPTWLWLTAAAVMVLGISALWTVLRLDRGRDDQALCPTCGTRIDLLEWMREPNANGRSDA